MNLLRKILSLLLMTISNVIVYSMNLDLGGVDPQLTQQVRLATVETIALRKMLNELKKKNLAIKDLQSQLLQADSPSQRNDLETRITNLGTEISALQTKTSNTESLFKDIADRRAVVFHEDNERIRNLQPNQNRTTTPFKINSIFGALALATAAGTIYFFKDWLKDFWANWFPTITLGEQ